jgi:hypothetical protein
MISRLFRGILFHQRSSTNLCTYSREKYVDNLYKKFLFYVHPDFFGGFDKERSINDTNIKILSQTLKGNIDTGNTRSIVFYIKCMDENTNPRRVKISLNRIDDSLREVLETLGVELPPAHARLDTAATGRATLLSCNVTDISDFLDTLLDK